MSFLTNPKQAPTTKVSRRPGGGWGDDAEEPQLRNAGTVYGDNRTKTQEVQAPMKEQTRQNTKPQNSIAFELENCDQDFLKSHEYENKIVSDVIQPGGARVKQPDSTLHEFCNTCEHLKPTVVGSILMSKFDEQNGWIPKARVIFAIETLSKKFERYFNFFKHNVQALQKVGFTSEGLNANQLRNLMNGLMRLLNHPSFSAELQKENQTFSKPSGPTLPHNNSQGYSKPQTSSVGLAATKSASLPEPVQSNKMKYASHIALNTVKDSASPSNTTPVNKESPVKTENTTKPTEPSTTVPMKPVTENAVPVNNSQSQQLNIPLGQGNSLLDSLGDVDFSNDNVRSPNNIYNLYKAQSPANLYGSPSNFGPGYMGGYSPAYYANYPNQQVQGGGFNAYVQGNAGGIQQQQQQQQQQQNMGYPVNSNNQWSQNNEQGKMNGDDDIFNQASEIDYDREEREKEKEKQKKREEIEKRFASLNF